MGYEGEFRKKRFLKSRHFIAYVIIMLIYGFVSVVAFCVFMGMGVMLKLMNASPDLADIINNTLGPISLLNLLFILPSALVLGLIAQYLSWKISLPLMTKLDAIAAMDKEAKGLLTDLDEPDSRARLATVKALRTMNRPFVVDALTKTLLTDPSLDVRAEAYRSLRFMGLPRAGLLLDRLKMEQDRNERLMLIRLLDTTGDMDQISPLIDLYQAESDKEAKRSILEALSQFNDESVKDLATSVLRNDEDRDLRFAALQAIQWYDDDETGDILKHLLNDPDDAIRVRAGKLFKLQGVSPENVIIEVEKKPCPYCGQLTDCRNDKCPSCGAPMRERSGRASG
jgi:hypothetical protein